MSATTLFTPSTISNVYSTPSSLSIKNFSTESLIFATSSGITGSGMGFSITVGSSTSTSINGSDVSLRAGHSFAAPTVGGSINMNIQNPIATTGTPGSIFLNSHTSKRSDSGIYCGFTSSATVISSSITSWATITISGVTITSRKVIWIPELELFCGFNANTATATAASTSSDGTTWTARTTPNALYNDLALSPLLRLIVAVGNTFIITSANAITWVSVIRLSASYIEWSEELGIYVAVSGVVQNLLYRSIDGLSWESYSTNNSELLSINLWVPDLQIFCGTLLNFTPKCIAISYDGITIYPQLAVGTLNTWISCAWSSELQLLVFCSSSSSGTDTTRRIMTSPDSILWTTRTTPNFDLMSIIWSSELSTFCAVGLVGSLITSSDGITWTQQTVENRAWFVVSWSPKLNMFAAFANTSSVQYLMVSKPVANNNTLGTTISNVSFDNAFLTINGNVTSYANTNLLNSNPVIQGNLNSTNLGRYNMLYRSTENITNDIFSNLSYYTIGFSLDVIVWSPQLEIFCSVFGSSDPSIPTVSYSSNGIDWTTVYVTSVHDWSAMVWSPEQELFCAVSEGTTTLTNNLIMVSPNGSTWFTKNSPNYIELLDVCWSPELALFCAVGSEVALDKNIIISPDGSLWYTATTGQNQTWKCICWSSELGLFCVGSALKLCTSNNGITWISRTPDNANFNLNSICWSNYLQTFCGLSSIASPGTNTTLRSIDGITWTTTYTKIIGNSFIKKIAWNDQLQKFIVNSSDTNSPVYISDSGLEWTTYTSPFSVLGGINYSLSLRKMLFSAGGQFAISQPSFYDLNNSLALGSQLNTNVTINGNEMIIGSAANTVSIGASALTLSLGDSVYLDQYIYYGQMINGTNLFTGNAIFNSYLCGNMPATPFTSYTTGINGIYYRAVQPTAWFYAPRKGLYNFDFSFQTGNAAAGTDCIVEFISGSGIKFLRVISKCRGTSTRFPVSGNGAIYLNVGDSVNCVCTNIDLASGSSNYMSVVRLGI